MPGQRERKKNELERNWRADRDCSEGHFSVSGGSKREGTEGGGDFVVKGTISGVS